LVQGEKTFNELGNAFPDHNSTSMTRPRRNRVASLISLRRTFLTMIILPLLAQNHEKERLFLILDLLDDKNN
jgi:hypothetical protein